MPLSQNLYEENVVNTLAVSFIIESSFLLTKKVINSRMSSKCSRIRLWNAGLAAIKRYKIPIDL